MESGLSKRALRAEARARRAARSADDIASLSRSATAHLVDFLDALKPRSAAVFLSSDREPQTRDLIAHLAAAGIIVWAPHSLDDGVLHWSEVDLHTPVFVGPHGVPEPESATEGRLAHVEPDVVMCPAALVDRYGTRLGWGKGYYDRFLATLGPHTRVIALVFDDEVVDKLPRDEHDIPVTHIATPSGVQSVAANS